MTSLRQAWGQRLVQLAEHDPRILVLDADLATSTKADLFAEAHPDRFLQMGIAEQNMVGMAAGLAAHGYVPWLSSFAIFFTHRALDPIRMLLAQTGANVKIAAGYAGLLTGLTGRTHQDVEDLAIMRAMPGMAVLCPGDAIECAAMIDWATGHDGPVYLRLSRDEAGDVFGADYTFEPGAVRTLREGRDLVLVSTGVQTRRVLDAANMLSQRHGLEATVVHVPTIKPVCEPALLRALAGHSEVIVIEEHSIYGGLGGLVAELVTSAGVAPSVMRIGIQDRWSESAPNDELLARYGLSAHELARTIHERVASSVVPAVRPPEFQGVSSA